jgi:hypothetical protein
MAGSIAPNTVVLGLLLLVGLAAAQRGTTPAVATPAPDLGCSSIQLTYNFMDRTKIWPFVSDKNKQPYAFHANVTMLNSGTRPLKSWAALVTLGYGEILVGVDGETRTRRLTEP